NRPRRGLGQRRHRQEGLAQFRKDSLQPQAVPGQQRAERPPLVVTIDPVGQIAKPLPVRFGPAMFSPLSRLLVQSRHHLGLDPRGPNRDGSNCFFQRCAVHVQPPLAEGGGERLVFSKYVLRWYGWRLLPCGVAWIFLL